MKKYMQPSTEIMRPIIILMAGESINNYVGNGVQLDNGGVFDETEETNPSKDNSVWDDAQQNDGI